MKRLLITGSSGMFGSNIVAEIEHNHEIFGFYKNYPNPELKNQIKIDLTNFNRVKSVVNFIDPDFVIHCAALTNVDHCEENFKLAREVNAVATRNLTSFLKPEIRFIYISTDSVFDGKKGKYSETDLPAPLNNYAKSKLEGEYYVEQLSRNYVIVRTNIFGWNRVKKNGSFAERVFNKLSQKKPINMFIDVIFSPITVNTLSLLIERLLSIDFVGRLHIGSTNSMSKYIFGVQLAKVFNFKSSLISPISVDKLRLKAKRPKNTSLDVSKANNIFGSLPTVEEEINRFCEKRIT